MKETRKIVLDSLSQDQIRALLGAGDRNLYVLCECLDHDIYFRDDVFMIPDCDEQEYQKFENVLKELLNIVHKNRAVLEQDVIYACRMADRDEKADFEKMTSHIAGRTIAGKAIVPKTRGQLKLIEAMEQCPVVFAVGPAGTGKTYLAVVQAVSAMKRGDVKRIVLTRPAVEAGENLGFLPGDLKEKVDPYLTPLYDALHDMLGTETTARLMEKGTIEVAPLAYMRGRTLDDAYIILDEAQNTTISQMKMFLTRLGFHSRMVINGDVTQIDLEGKRESGLVQAIRILGGIKDIAVVELSTDDVVRHPLVQKIIERYEAEGRGRR